MEEAEEDMEEAEEDMEESVMVGFSGEHPLRSPG